ncbi:hypothetical protein [Thermococcus aciditolerans]|uniref:Uncharacterized protein n=1 Tax=Thermococcus aciditolerans TaxID=2598455 RepID=A0A5C0SQV3_9EURY|nr:hypothetical protein [Thermococcus aciditolerans]QEK15754.1 hypothetical protein FPV09_02960 [Thermococcus aciditolerans]
MVSEERLRILLEDLGSKFVKDDVPKIRSALLALRKVSEIPVSRLNPSTGYHPVVIFKRRFGRIQKEVPVSIVDLKVLNRYNMPGWRREIEFWLDNDVALQDSIMGIEALMIGDPRQLNRLGDVLRRILQQMNYRPRRLILFYSTIYMDFGADRYIQMDLRGGDMELTLINMKLSEASSYLGRAITGIDSSFGNKNMEFYKLLFAYATETRSSFDWFFHRYIYPRLNPEQKEFFEEMQDYRNFLTLLYSYMNRLNKDRIGTEVGIRVIRRANPKRPLEIGIVFTNRGIEIRRYANNVQISFMV